MRLRCLSPRVGGRDPRGIPKTLLFAVVWMLASGTALAGPLPNTLKILPNGPGGMSLVMQNITYSTNPANAGAPVAGQGDLVIMIAGTTLPAQASIPFANVVADDSGQVTGGGIALNKDATISNLFGSGVDLVLGKGAQFTVLVKGQSAQCAGNLSAKLPFRSETGEQEVLNLPSAVTLNTNGEFAMDVKGAALSGPTAKDGITLAGFNLRMAAMDLSLKHPGANGSAFTLSFNIPTVAITTPIPNLLTQDDKPLTIVANNCGIDDQGQVTFGNAHLAKLVDERYQVASAGGVPPPPEINGPHVIHLAQPLDFVITVQKADVSVDHNRFTKCSLSGDLALPPDLKDAKGDRVEIKGVTIAYDAAQNKLSCAIAAQPQPIEIHWNSFGLKCNGLAFEFGGANPGVTIVDGQLELPDFFSAGGGKKPAVAVKNFTVDSHGVTGGVVVTPGLFQGIKLMDFSVDITSGTIQFSRNKLVAGALRGAITIPAWNNDKIDINAGMSSSGMCTVDVDSSKPLSVSKFGMTVNLTGGSLQVQGDGKTRLMLTGSLSFPGIAQMGDAALAFKDLGVDSDGHFYLPSGWLTLPHPADVNLGILSVNCSQLGFGHDNAKGDWVGVTGGVKLADDLPVTGSIDFSGLKIYENAKAPEIGTIHMKAKVMGVGTLDGTLEHPTDASDPAVKQFGDCCYGDASLALDCFGGAGIDLKFLVGKNAWFVGGGLVLPTGIPLPLPPPPTGPLVALYGFHGGFGHGVGIKPGTGQVGGISDFEVKPGNWVAQAGVLLGSFPDQGHLWWGDLTLTLGFPELMIDLNGKATFVSLDPPGNHDSAWWEKQDRYGTADICWDSSSSTFRATVAADLCFPTRDIALLHATGGLELLISPDEGHLWIGWPRDQHPISVSMLGINCSGGIGIGLWKSQYIKAGIHYGADFGIIKGYIDGEAGLETKPSFRIYGKISAEGEVDFAIFHASAGAECDASYNGSRLDLCGEFHACIGCFLGDICCDTGHVCLSVP